MNQLVKSDVLVSQLTGIDSLYDGEELYVPQDLNGIRFSWTKRVDLLSKYFTVRNAAYNQLTGKKSFFGLLDGVDANSEFLVAMYKGKCIGGLRHSIVTPASNLKLPLEDNDFKLRDLLPELKLEDCAYGEYSRLALIDEQRYGKVFDLMAHLASSQSIKNNMKYVFAIVTATQARRYSIVNKNAYGFKYEILRHISIPHRSVYGKLNGRMFLSCFYINERTN